jgi:hypothetical protein
MKQTAHYSSEFEQAFELDDLSTGAHETDELSGAYELEDDLLHEAELEADEEWEMSGETSEANADYEDMLYEHAPGGQDYEERLYHVFAGEHESSYEMEREIDDILHEMQKDYFFGGFRKLANKYKGAIGRAVKNYLPANALSTLGNLAGGDLRGLLKSNLLRKGLTLAANGIAPGIGGAVAGALLNNESAALPDLRKQAAQFTGVARNAFQNLAGSIPSLKPGNIPAQLRALSQNALRKAMQQQSGNGSRNRQVIALSPGATVSVNQHRVVIYYR